jgi:hypothetical protein
MMGRAWPGPTPANSSAMLDKQTLFLKSAIAAFLAKSQPEALARDVCL